MFSFAGPDEIVDTHVCLQTGSPPLQKTKNTESCLRIPSKAQNRLRRYLYSIRSFCDRSYNKAGLIVLFRGKHFANEVLTV
jgi:hypothetical protein